MYMFIIARLHTGEHVPRTVTKRHAFLPNTSDNFPKAGHEIKASSPLMHSAHPITKYILWEKVCRSRVGITALVMDSARNSNNSTGRTYPKWGGFIVLLLWCGAVWCGAIYRQYLMYD
jgi:hypothetical protein